MKILNEVWLMQMNDFKYQIEMLDVKDGDAFILYFEWKDKHDKKRTQLIVVDAGHYEKDRCTVLDHINTYYPRKKIDLAIVTHCDEDHFGGFVRMLEYATKENVPVKRFLLNIPSRHISEDEINGVEPDIVYSVDKTDCNSQNLVKLIGKLEIPCEECFAELIDDETCLSFPDFFILGPTKKYYEEVVKGFRFDGLGEKIDT